MSRAFVKEPDGSGPSEGLPDRPISEHPNYVTRAGLRQLHERVRELQERRSRLLAEARQAAASADDPALAEEIALLDRDLRYYAARVDGAILIDPAEQPADHVGFGMTVSVEDPRGEPQRFTIVGEDEADVSASRISYVSPLARALEGARVGEKAHWRRPAGDLELTIVAIDRTV